MDLWLSQRENPQGWESELFTYPSHNKHEVRPGYAQGTSGDARGCPVLSLTRGSVGTLAERGLIRADGACGRRAKKLVGGCVQTLNHFEFAYPPLSQTQCQRGHSGSVGTI